MTVPRPTHWTTCPHCGKRGYHTRRDAKAALRQTAAHGPARHLNVYACPAAPDTWHIGTLPPAVARGRADRRALTHVPDPYEQRNASRARGNT